MLNSLDLIKLLKNCKWFGGVFPSNHLPIAIKKPMSFVVNLDPSYEKGSHWVAINFTRFGRAIYFDSFGRKPEGNILTFIEQNTTRGYEYSPQKYQANNSTACGYFCVLFIMLANKPKQFFSLFKKCKHNLNEKRLKTMINCMLENE